MDIQEAREAFERRQAKVLNVPYEGLKAHFDENSRLFGARYNTGSINEKEWNLWLEAWQAKAQAVPEGFVLMPKEPTDEIIEAMNEFDYRNDYSDMDGAYRTIVETLEKAQAVSEGFGDIQSWIAVNSFSALDSSIVDFPVVDANELAEFIDSLNIHVAVPEGFVLVKKVHPDAIVHNQGLGLFKECQVIYGWDGKSKDFKDALNKGFYHGVKLGAKAVLETAMIEAQEQNA